MQDFEPRTRSNKGWIVVTAIFLGMAYLFVQEGMRTGKVKDVFAAAPVATSTPAPAAVRAEPTVSYPATIAAYQNDAQNSREQAVSAQETAVNAIALVVNANIAAAQITLTSDNNKIILAKSTETQQANELVLADKKNEMAKIKLTQDALNLTATPAAIQNGLMAVKAENDAKYSASERKAKIFSAYMWPIAAVLAVVVLAVVLTHNYKAALAQQEYDQNNPAPAQSAVAIHEHLDGGETIKMIQPPPCTVEIFREWAGRMLSGDSAAINHWEADDSPFNGKDYRRQFYPWLVASKLIKFDLADGRSVLSDRGMDYCNDWLIRNPTHSPDGEVSPKTAPRPSARMENMGMDGAGGYSNIPEPFPQ